MEYRQLLNFLSVCEERHITKASKRRFITQQGLSKSIKDLEDELEVPLFERTHHGIVLTEFGQVLETAARTYTNQHDYIIETLRQMKEKSRFRLSIGITNGIYEMLPPRFLSTFMSANPDVSLNIRTFTDDMCQKSVLEQGLQIGFSLPPFETTMFDTFLYQKHRIVVIAGKEHHFAGRSSIKLRDLRDERVMALNNRMYPQNILTKLCAQNGISLDVQLNCPDKVLMTELCVSNQFVSFFAGSVEEFDNLVSIEIEDVELFVEFYIIVNKHAYINKAAEQFLAYAKETLLKPMYHDFSLYRDPYKPDVLQASLQINP
jgi:DNA-binding transcriptional LysR family regulator